MKRIVIFSFLILMIAAIAVAVFYFSRKTAVAPSPSPSPSVSSSSILYQNTQYRFKLTLPLSWLGYSIVNDKWEGNTSGSSGDVVVQQGSEILIRHPLWTTKVPRQDIPIMVFTIDQWKALQNDQFHIGAAPIGPSELGRNSLFVFALPARYNYAFQTGWEEVEKIIQSNALMAL
jgi:hypothetical protein